MRVKLMLRLAVVMLTCLLLWAALLWLRPASPVARADPGSLFVAATGTGAACSQAQPCALQTALAQAVNGDTVYLGAGTYTGGGDAVITIATSLTLYGGWNGAPSGPVVRDPHVYTSTVDGESQRRVVHVDSGTSVTLEGFTVARGMVIGDGGGLYANGLALTLRAMTFMSNAITSTEYCWGAGAFVEGGTLLVEASTFRRNWGFGTRSSYGGGIAISRTLTTTVAGCQFEDNDTWFGCGVDVVGAGRSQTQFSLTGSTFVNNGRGYSGNMCSGGYAVAIEVSNAHARIEGNTIRGSYGSNDYGAVAVFASDLTLTGNLIIDNNSGRTAALYLHSVNPFAVTNNVIAANRMSSAGSPAVRVIGGSGQFVHNTIACNEGGPGLLIDSGATVWLTDTIVVSHTLGISVSAGSTVTMEATLWGSGPWANRTDQAGGGAITAGAVNVRGDPAFVDPAGRDYHIGALSAAIDAGVNAGVSVDIDGDPRPCGSGYDIGADEYCGPVVRRFVYLPLVLRVAGR